MFECLAICMHEDLEQVKSAADKPDQEAQQCSKSSDFQLEFQNQNQKNYRNGLDCMLGQVELPWLCGVF